MAKRRMTKARRQRILDAHGNRCGKCGGDGPFDIDHKHALALGGSDDDDNLWPLCKACHSTKTNGHGGTSYGSDKHAIAKLDRLTGETKSQWHGSDKPSVVKSWQSRPLESRPFKRQPHESVWPKAAERQG